MNAFSGGSGGAFKFLAILTVLGGGAYLYFLESSGYQTALHPVYVKFFR